MESPRKCSGKCFRQAELALHEADISFITQSRMLAPAFSTPVSTCARVEDMYVSGKRVQGWARERETVLHRS